MLETREEERSSSHSSDSVQSRELSDLFARGTAEESASKAIGRVKQRIKDALRRWSKGRRVLSRLERIPERRTEEKRWSDRAFLASIEEEELAHVSSVGSVELVGVSSPENVLVVLDVVWEGGREEMVRSAFKPLSPKVERQKRTEHLKVEISRHTEDGLDTELGESA